MSLDVDVMGTSFLRIQNLAFVATLLCCLGNSAADPRTTVAGQMCENTTSVSASALANNFVIAMGNLSNLVGQNGFGNMIVGEGPTAVYGLAQCFEDLNSVDCKLCFSEIRSQLPKCYPATGGMIFLDGCFGRYENHSFFNEISGPNDKDVCSSARTNSSARTFAEVVRDVIGNVSSQAPKNRGFAVGSVSSSVSTVYGLAQCWQNLDEQLCTTCLRTAAASVVSCAPSIEGRSLNSGCYIRYSNNLFWNLYPSAPPPDSSEKHALVWILLGTLLGTFLLIVGLLVLWKCFCRKSNTKSLEALYGPQLSEAISKSNLNYQYETLKKATNNFSLSNKLGQGSYGTVYKAILNDGKEVAVKRLFLNARQWIDRFFNEVNLVHTVRHKNLVKLLGCSVDGPESLLVFEYYPNGSLDHYIFDSDGDRRLDWKQRYEIIQGVAEGLSYLHEESETRIIHRDIKASNILVDEKFRAKITDFGLARSFAEDQSHLSTAVAGTPGYMAPEYVIHGRLTEKADVYSFGMVALETITGIRCSATTGSRDGDFLVETVWNHYKGNTIEKIVDRSIYSENVHNEISHVLKIGLFCTQGNPYDRPTMSKVVEMLRRTGNQEIVLSDSSFLNYAAPVEEESSREGESSHLLYANLSPDN